MALYLGAQKIAGGGGGGGGDGRHVYLTQGEYDALSAAGMLSSDVIYMTKQDPSQLGVSKIVAGEGISITPAEGVGEVTISASSAFVPEAVEELSGKVGVLSTDYAATKADYASTKSNVAGIDSRLQIVEGQMGLLVTGYIQCYIAPAAQYFIDNGFTASVDGDGRTYYTKDGAEYSYGGGHFYPGDDDNLELQYAEFGKTPYKYPLFTLAAAMEFLRRFRANGITTYQVYTQYGDYEYNDIMAVELADAVAGSNLVIGVYPSL